MSRKPDLGKISPREFSKLIDKELAALKRRVERIEAARHGDYRVERVWRKGHTVPKHKVRGHYMLLIRSSANAKR